MGKKKSDAPRGFTTSSLPGTTLNFLRLTSLGASAIVDTPGLILRHQLTSSLEPEELKSVMPVKRVDHVTLRVGEGKSVLLGGLARVEFIEGRPFFLTFFVAPGVKVHPTSAQGDKADTFVRAHIGALLSPPASEERLDALGELTSHDIQISGRGWQEASCDIVLSGLGWFSVTGQNVCP